MKFLGIDTEGVRLVGKFTFTNTTEFPIVVSLWQTGPLYYRVIKPDETWSTDCGSVWFTVKAWLYNGENNINPGIKYSLLAGNIVGFAALGALGLGASALASQYGVSARNPDWEEWLMHNNLVGMLDDVETIKGLQSIARCEFSQAGYYAGKHPHLYISGGPVKHYGDGEKRKALSLEWHEIRVDKCAFDNDVTPLIMVSEQAASSVAYERYTDDWNRQEPIGRDEDPDARDHGGHQISLIDNEDAPPAMPQRPGRAKGEVKPPMPPRPSARTMTTSEFTASVGDEFEYKISA